MNHMPVDLKKKLTFVSIRDLLNQTFYIPGYQRGYRWQPGQVLALLNDIWDFSKKCKEKNQNNVKYCLQPLVVSQRNSNEWEVIDGQQRLTTIFLILQRLEIISEVGKCYSIKYETPYSENMYLLEIDGINPNDTIDSYHISEALNIIDFWLEKHFGTEKDQKRKLFRALVDVDEYLAQFIWYNVTDEVKDNDSLAIDIFDRLNVGKIGLTNAELIKALFMTSMLNGTEQREIDRRRIQMGQEWDRIEVTLAQPAFWNFVSEKPDAYVTKIEYLFDILKDKNKDDERDYTFNCYYQEINESTDSNIVTSLWKKVSDLFQTFSDWYSDKEYYHIVGYLVASGIRIKSILSMRYKEDSNELKTKEQFKQDLLKRAKESIYGIDLEDDELFIKLANKKHEIRKVLLLFNIMSILSSKDTSLHFMRFPFDKYREKDEKGRVIWDIEHIRSQSDKEIEGQDRQEWIETLILYFTGEDNYSDAKDLLDSVDSFKKYYSDQDTRDQAFLFCSRLNSFHGGVSVERKLEFEKLQEDLRKYFHEDDDDFKIHSLGNLTLLDKGTNRSYRNAFFQSRG